MLFSPEDFNTPLTNIPHRRNFLLWRNRLSDDEFIAIVEEFKRISKNKEVLTSSWIPGNDWSGTVYEPIYTKSCNFDEEQSGLCFGLFLYEYFMNHCNDERWSFIRAEKDGKEIKGFTYFRID